MSRCKPSSFVTEVNLGEPSTMLRLPQTKRRESGQDLPSPRTGQLIALGTVVQIGHRCPTVKVERLGTNDSLPGTWVAAAHYVPSPLLEPSDQGSRRSAWR